MAGKLKDRQDEATPAEQQGKDAVPDEADNNATNDNTIDANAEVNELPAVADVPQQVWEWVCWAGAKTYDGIDFAGEVLADFLGLTHSKYQWMLDMQEREREEKRLRRLEARQRRQLRLEQLLAEERRKLAALETGGNDNQTESA